MEVASTYIPLDRRHALAHGQNLPEYTTGAALFADISGFTPLTETLSRQFGPQRGVEELTRQLELVYTAIIAEVERYHGSVISFSGDAITCWFDGAEDLATRQATTAALAMQVLMRQFVAQPLPSGDSLDLEMTAAVACGPIRRCVVGDPNLQLFDTLAGATLERLVAIEELANRGEVVLSIEAVKLLEDDLTFNEWRSTSNARVTVQCAVVSALKVPAQAQPWPPLSSSALTEVQTRPWLLPEVHQRLQNVRGNFLAELRQAVAIFLRFGGLDYDSDPDVSQKLDAFVRWAQQVVARYEGSLLQLTIGDKGSYLYIVFGAFLSHEDDAARSVAAARVLCQPPTNLKFISTIQVGISKGRLRAGPYGSSTYRTYGLLGDDVNLAARLMQTARAGQIIVSGRIARAATGHIWEPLQPLVLKGRAEPVSAFALVTSTAPLLSRAQTLIADDPLPLIGRETEQAALAVAFDNLEKQQSQTIIISGEAGIGKSRLVSSVLGETRVSGFVKLFGFGDAIEQSTPYYGWRAVFSQLFGWEAMPDDGAARREQVLQQLPPELHGRAPLLNAVLPLDWPENELTASILDSQVRADTIREFLLEILLAAVHQRLTVLVLEDAHWFDSASWSLALAVSRRVHPLLLLVVARPWNDQPAAEYLQLTQSAGIKSLILESLSAENALTLVCQQLGVSALPPVMSQLIRDKAGGHPFFSEELAFALRDAGLIQIDRERGECRVTPNVDLTLTPFPDTVQDVITHRIDKLTPQQQLTLKAASVIGRTFAVRLLADIHPEEKQKPVLIRQLDILDKLGLTPLESVEPELMYFFRHAITQEVAYNLMLFSQRRQLHHAIAQWYELAYAENLAPFYPVLSYHWSRAENSIKAIEYLEKAGERALADGANPEAVKFFSEALALTDGQPPNQAERSESEALRRAGWMFGLGKAYRALGEMPLSREYLENAIAVFDRAVPVGQSQKVLGLLRQVGRQMLHLSWPSRFIGRATLTERVRLLKAYSNYQELTALYILSSEQFLGLYVALRVINTVERAGHSPELAMAYGIVGLLSGLVGLRSLAERYFRLGFEIANALNHRAAQRAVLIASSLYRAGLGQLLRAKAEIVQAINVLPHYAIDAVGILGTVDAYLGNFRSSLTTYASIYKNRDRHGELAMMLGLTGQAGQLLYLGQTDSAVALLAQAIELPVERATEKISAYGLLAWGQLRKSDWTAAEETAEYIANLIARSSAPFLFSTLAGYRAPAQVYLTLWEREPNRRDWQAKAKHGCRVMWSFTRTFPMGESAAWLYEGGQHWLSGRFQQARSTWHKSLNVARKFNMPYEEAQALYEIGRHAGGDEREKYLTEALQLFEKLEATYDVDLIRGRLTATRA